MAAAFTPEALAKARQDGFSDTEIQAVLGEGDERFSKAFQDGFTLDEIVTVLAPKQPEPDRSFSGALRQGLDAPLEAIGTTAEVFGLKGTGKAIKGLTEAPVNYESAAERVVKPQEGDVTVAGFGVGSIPRAITEQLGQVAGTIISRAVGALAGRVIGGAIGGTAGSGTGPGALLTGATGQAVGSKVGSFVAPFAFQAMQIAGPTALERARNNGRTEPNKEDLAYALTTAAASGSLDAIGAKFLPGGEKAVGSWVGKIGKAMLGEAATETPQSIVEQAGGTLGTKAGLKIDPKQAIAEGLIGAGAGGAAAGVAIGTGSAVDAIKSKVKATVDQVDATIAEVATAEPPPISTPSAEPARASEPIPEVTAETPEGSAQAEVVSEPQGGELTDAETIRSNEGQIREGDADETGQGESGPNLQQQASVQASQPKDQIVRSAYESFLEENPEYPDVTIAELQKRSGLPLAELHDWIGKNAPNITLSRGDQVYGSEEAKAAALPNTSDPANPWQRIKLEDHFRQGKPDAPDDTSATGQIPPIAQPPGTEGQGTDQAPEAAPPETGTATVSAAQLEDQIGKLLDRHQAEKDPAVQSRLWEQAKGLVDQLEKVEGKSLGPGAASAAEKLAMYALRKFGIRLQDDPRVAAEIKEAAGNRYYEVLPNKVTAAEATDLIDRVGEDQAERMVRDNKSDASFAVRSTVGQILMRRLNQRYSDLKKTDPKAAEEVLRKSADLAEWEMEFGTNLGQGVQSFAMWARLSADGKLYALKRQIRKARETHTQKNKKNMDQVMGVLSSDKTSEEKTAELAKLRKKNPIARKIKKQTKKLASDKQTEKSFYDIASKALGLPELTAEQEAEMREIAARVDAAPEGLPKWKAGKEFFTKMRNQLGFTVGDLALGYFYGNILSGSGTHLTNILDTFANVQNDLLALAVSNPRAAATIYSGMAKGLKMGSFDAVLGFTQGRRVSATSMGDPPGVMEGSRFGEKGGVNIIGTDPISKFAKAIAESKVGYPLNAWKYVGRAMTAEDAVQFRGAQEAKAGLIAFDIATKEGLSSSQRAKRVNEILGWNRFDEFMQQASDEGYKGVERAARANELMIMQRPEGLQQQASDFASTATFNDKPRGVIGKFATGIAGITREIPAGKLVVPFTSIVANVFNRKLDNLPGVAIYRAKSGNYYHSEEEANLAIVRGFVSLGLIATVVSLRAAGVLDITGPGPDDSEKRRQLRQTGWRPYSVKIGDTYFSYASLPISLGLGIAGQMFDRERYGKDNPKKEKAYLESLTYAVMGLASYLMSQSFLSGLAGFVDIFQEKGGKMEAAFRKFASGTVSAFGPLSGLMKDLDNLYDDTVRENKTLGAAIVSQIPFARYAGKPALNAFGEPIHSGRLRPVTRFANQKKEDPAWQLIADKGLRVPVPDPFFKTNDLNYEYQKQAGKNMRKWVESNSSMLRSMSTEKAQKELSNANDRMNSELRAKITWEQFNASQEN